MEPTKYEIERAFYRILDNGDETAIAKELGHSPSYVSQLYDPNNDRESTLSKAIRELRAWRRDSPERGAKALELFVAFVERDLEGEELDVIAETQKLKKQVDHWESIEMAAASPDARVDEIRGIQFQAGRALKAHGQWLRLLAARAITEKRVRAGK